MSEHQPTESQGTAPDPMYTSCDECNLFTECQWLEIPDEEQPRILCLKCIIKVADAYGIIPY